MFLLAALTPACDSSRLASHISHDVYILYINAVSRVTVYSLVILLPNLNQSFVSCLVVTVAS